MIQRIKNVLTGRLFVPTTLLMWIVYSYLLMLSYIPDEIYLTTNQVESIQKLNGLPVTASYEKGTTPVFGVWNANGNTSQQGYLECRLFDIIPMKQVSVHVTSEKQVIAAGTNIGIYLKNAGVLVVDNASFRNAKGALISPSVYRIKRGDIIRAVNGTVISTKEELIEAVNESEGERMILEIIRDQEKIELAVSPELSNEGRVLLGLWVRDDIAGIGTLTYIQENGTYGALGHGISDIDSGDLISIDSGKLYETQITGISKGRRGAPGEVSGLIRYKENEYLGSVNANTTIGIYGKLERMPEAIVDSDKYTLGYKQEIELGPATIISSVSGERKMYQIEIDAVDYHPKEVNKGLRYHVTDSELLETTGGIVQGMSGSPIIQNNKLIGAVTHVFVDDPAKGYGIFIETMLEK
ncbi:MAG: SpoIVB peptidase [bacterium]|nr:SpoIVB peptidase [bacterium]